VLPLHPAHESHALTPLHAAQAHAPETSCLCLPIQHLSGMLVKQVSYKHWRQPKTLHLIWILIHYFIQDVKYGRGSKYWKDRIHANSDIRLKLQPCLPVPAPLAPVVGMPSTNSRLKVLVVEKKQH
jgi:hypothetical protein